MKDYCSLQFRRFSFFIWIIGCVVFVRDVKCYSEVFVPEYRVPCVPGQEGWVDSVLQWMPEELKNPDSICVNGLGTGSYLCREEYNGNYSSICDGMWCRDPILETCIQVSTNDGVQCGDKKWCSGGVCRYSEQATVTSESCPFGDSSTFSSGGMTCQEMVSRDRRLCYDDATEQNCCQSCQAVRSSRQSCQYGDLIDGCEQENCPLMTEDQLETCCQTCGYYIVIVPPQQPPVTTPRTTSSPRTTPAQNTTTGQRNTTGQQQAPSTSVGTESTTQTPGSTSQAGVTTTTRNVPPQTTPSSQTTQAQPSHTTQSQTPQTSRTESPTSSQQPTGTKSSTVTTNVPVVTSSQQPTGTKSSTVTTNVPAMTSSQQPTGTKQSTVTTNVPAVTSSQQPTGRISSTVTTNVPGVTSSQQPTGTISSTDTTNVPVTSSQQPTGRISSTVTTNVPAVTSSQQPTGTISSSDTTNVPVATSSQQPTGGPTSQAPDSSSQGQTAANNLGQADAQQGNPNAVTIGTGAGVGVAVVIIIIIVVVYVVKTRMMTSEPPLNNPEDDTHSVEGNSYSDVTASMTAASTTWYPNYRATHTLSPE